MIHTRALLRTTISISSLFLTYLRTMPSSSNLKPNEMLQVKLLSKHAKMPVRSSPQSAGFDLSSAEKTVVSSGGCAIVKTDLSIACPDGTYGRIAPRR